MNPNKDKGNAGNRVSIPCNPKSVSSTNTSVPFRSMYNEKLQAIITKNMIIST